MMKWKHKKEIEEKFINFEPNHQSLKKIDEWKEHGYTIVSEEINTNYLFKLGIVLYYFRRQHTRNPLLEKYYSIYKISYRYRFLGINNGFYPSTSQVIRLSLDPNDNNRVRVGDTILLYYDLPT